MLIIKKTLFIILLLNTIFVSLHGVSEDYIMYSGLLYGKNYYIPHLLTYSFPGFSPRKGEKGEVDYSCTYTGINEFALYDNYEVALDYESSVLESSITYRPLDNLLIGIDIRFISYYGGFMDSIIDIWHTGLDLPDAGRNKYSNSEIDIFVDNSDGKSPALSDEGIYLGDTDLYGVLNISQTPNYSLALASAAKISTGSFSNVTSSGYVDLGIQVLGEYYFNNRLVVGLQQGFVFPGEVILNIDSEYAYANRIQSQTFCSIQFYPNKDIGFITQLRINTSPISSDRIKTTGVFADYTFFTLPQTSLIIGIKKYFGDYLTQFSIEEDPLSYEGVDIQFSLRITKTYK